VERRGNKKLECAIRALKRVLRDGEPRLHRVIMDHHKLLGYRGTVTRLSEDELARAGIEVEDTDYGRRYRLTAEAEFEPSSEGFAHKPEDLIRARAQAPRPRSPEPHIENTYHRAYKRELAARYRKLTGRRLDPRVEEELFRAFLANKPLQARIDSRTAPPASKAAVQDLRKHGLLGPATERSTMQECARFAAEHRIRAPHRAAQCWALSGWPVPCSLACGTGRYSGGRSLCATAPVSLTTDT
jgi:hypothetical protein